MGEFISKHTFDVTERSAFVNHLIDDIKALEILLQKNLFEDDVVRIGAEQELCLVDGNHSPKSLNLELLKKIDDSHFTTELASYNMEINLDPFELKGDCFSKVEAQLQELLHKGTAEAEKLKVKLVLAGILPTIGKNEVSMDYLTPIPRYFALNEALTACKGGDFNLKIRGVDELSLRHNTVMFEACNTSFQLHLQIPSYDFIPSYNWSQAIAGPVLSVCCNSPMLMGRELWKETRIALFQQSLDTRKTSYALRDQTPRVGYGDYWEKGSVAEIFKADISKHRVLLTKPIKEGSLEQLKKGQIPKLEALCLHNGTVYRWNRPCYGIGGGKPHLRIENRYIPSGPSVIDEMANFAFWIGLMKGRPKEFDAMESQMNFKAAKTNFIKAARTGKESIFVWKDQQVTAKKLVVRELLPIAYDGLQKCKVAPKDIERLLGIIEARARGYTGAQWQVKNYRLLLKKLKTNEAVRQMTKAMQHNQQLGLPVHEWPMIDEKSDFSPSKFELVEEIMSTRLLKLHESDYANMALAIMRWNNIHHIPVENDKGELSGLLTWSYIESLSSARDLASAKVSDIMVTDVKTINPRTTIETAKKMMRDHGIGCLPVCVGNTMVGIISNRDL
ncbi:CBS domain-containing protein [Allomuricauda sp. d1]|uniref:CBS domain-containing protein n=1 Tax=Allomuricauda sp. d1 TaxID=3136725 RepID=UPI0031D0DB0E